MVANYYSRDEGTLASRLDIAWEDYQNDNLSFIKRASAAAFMVYVFDIKKLSNKPDQLNQQLENLMQKRLEHKSTNPEYIPIQNSSVYDFENTAEIISPLDDYDYSYYYDSDNLAVKSLLANNMLLNVNREDKDNDELHSISYLTTKERGEYRLEISDGKLCQEGLPFDSSEMIAHGKPGYVAFTLNANGELSVFKHNNHIKDEQNRILAHSSMNSGAPVIAAGEMEIRQGQVVSINTYSGHYQPSVYSLSRFVKFLNAKRVDISETKIYLQQEPNADSGLKAEEVAFYDDDDDEYYELWYELPAIDLLNTVEKIINSNLKSITDFISNEQKNRTSFVSNSKSDSIKLSETFKVELESIVSGIKTSSKQGYCGLDDAIKKVDALINKYQQYQLPNKLNNTFSEMKQNLKHAKDELAQQNREDEYTQEESHKKSF